MSELLVDRHEAEVEGLRRSPLFEELPDDHLAHLASRVQHRKFGDGEFVCRTGDPGNALFVIQSGEIKIGVMSPTGQEIIVALLGPGDTFGELALLDGAHRCASASAVGSSDLLVVYRDDFMAAIESDPEVNRSVLGALARVIRKTNEQLGDVAMLGVHSRIAKALLGLADRHGSECDEGVILERPVTEHELAGLTGLYPVEVRRALRGYQYDDLIRMRGDLMILRRVADLKRSAELPTPRGTMS